MGNMGSQEACIPAIGLENVPGRPRYSEANCRIVYVLPPRITILPLCCSPQLQWQLEPFVSRPVRDMCRHWPIRCLWCNISQDTSIRDFLLVPVCSIKTVTLWEWLFVYFYHSNLISVKHNMVSNSGIIPGSIDSNRMHYPPTHHTIAKSIFSEAAITSSATCFKQCHPGTYDTKIRHGTNLSPLCSIS